MQSDEFQDSLLDALERTYRAARTDATTGEILPVDIALGSLLDQICTAYAIPPEMLGEPLDTNSKPGWESQIEAYRRQFFGRKKR